MVRPSRALAALAAGAIAATVLFAGTTPAAASATLQVDAGYAGGFVPGRSLPVRVTVTADRLVAGTLEVTFTPGPPGPTVTDLQIEVPGGSVKRFTVVIPAPESSESGTVHVQLEAGAERAEGSARVDFHSDVELVGLLPSVQGESLPGATALAIDAGTARFAAVSADDLAAAPAALAPLGTIVAGADEIGTLDATAQRGLVSWLEEGGRLLVDALPGSAVAGLPPQYQPAALGRIGAGLGEVRLTGGAAAAGRWAEILEPTPILSPNQAANIGIGFFGNEPLGDSVARDAGVQVAKLGWLLLFLLAYVAVVGPVTYLALRRARRSELAWVVVPLLAVVFAGITFVAGHDLRRNTRAASGTILSVGAGDGAATTYVGLISRNGGDGSVSFPPGWVSGNLDTSFTGGLPTAMVRVVPRPSGPTDRIALDAGQFGVVAARGLVTVEGGLTVTATSGANGEARGTVRNTTPWTLEEVGVFVGRAGVNLGTIAPGAEKSWSVGPSSTPDDGFSPVESTVWGEQLGMFTGRPDLTGPVNLGLWSEAVRAGGPNFRAPGSAVAVGWTREFVPPADVGGQGDTAGRTAVVARSRVAPEAGTLPDLAVRRDLLRGVSIDRLGAGGGTSLYRFVLPADGAPVPAAGLTMAVPDVVTRVEAWAGGAWQVLDDRSPDPQGPINPGDPSAVHRVAVPAGATQSGIVYVRVTFDPNFGIFDASGLLLGAAA